MGVWERTLSAAILWKAGPKATFHSVIPRPKAEESHPLHIGSGAILMDEIPRFARDDKEGTARDDKERTARDDNEGTAQNDAGKAFCNGFLIQLR
jgi:hypothetical protein